VRMAGAAANSSGTYLALQVLGTEIAPVLDL
jgi:hypothetical protein